MPFPAVSWLLSLPLVFQRHPLWEASHDLTGTAPRMAAQQAADLSLPLGLSLCVVRVSPANPSAGGD